MGVDPFSVRSLFVAALTGLLAYPNADCEPKRIVARALEIAELGASVLDEKYPYPCADFDPGRVTATEPSAEPEPPKAEEEPKPEPRAKKAK